MLGQGGGTAAEPVRGMDVDMSNPPGGKYKHEGKTYYFHERGCCLDFEVDPQIVFAILFAGSTLWIGPAIRDVVTELRGGPATTEKPAMSDKHGPQHPQATL